jgi:hypothetical protein
MINILDINGDSIISSNGLYILPSTILFNEYISNHSTPEPIKIIGGIMQATFTNSSPQVRSIPLPGNQAVELKPGESYTYVSEDDNFPFSEGANGLLYIQTFFMQGITVIITDADLTAVKSTLVALGITYTQGDSADSVTGNLTLPASVNGPAGVAITWLSNNPACITNAGVVTRLDTNKRVTLTATATKNATSVSEDFIVNVISDPDYYTINSALSALNVVFTGIDSYTNVNSNVTLPSTVNGFGGVSITWTSNKSNIDVSTGKVTRPLIPEPNQDVTLTATATKNGKSRSRSYLLVVNSLYMDEAVSATALSELQIGYNSGDSASSVVHNLTLPTTLGQFIITWSSDNPSIISSTGVVSLPVDASHTVSLTAVANNNTDSGTRVFQVVVPQDPDYGFLDIAKAGLLIGYTSPDTSSTVTQNITLPSSVSGATGVVITWSSSDTVHMSNAGQVTRPLLAGTNAAVTMTATMTKNTKTETETFSLTVLKATE